MSQHAAIISWPEWDPIKNHFPLPNAIYHLELSAGAIAIYGYLLHIENRKTYQSYASYNTIGRAVKMSANTVRKYVMELEDKQLIRTEPTTITTKDGRKRNGMLRYNIRPIQETVDHYNEQQLRRLDAVVERQRVQARLSQFCAPQEPPQTTGRHGHHQQREAACRACVARCATRAASAICRTAM